MKFITSIQSTEQQVVRYLLDNDWISTSKGWRHADRTCAELPLNEALCLQFHAHVNGFVRSNDGSRERAFVESCQIVKREILESCQTYDGFDMEGCLDVERLTVAIIRQVLAVNISGGHHDTP